MIQKYSYLIESRRNGTWENDSGKQKIYISWNFSSLNEILCLFF